MENQVKEFIIAMSGQGHDAQNIVSTLVGAGWQQDVAEEAVRQYFPGPAQAQPFQQAQPADQAYSAPPSPQTSQPLAVEPLGGFSAPLSRPEAAQQIAMGAGQAAVSVNQQQATGKAKIPLPAKVLSVLGLLGLILMVAYYIVGIASLENSSAVSMFGLINPVVLFGISKPLVYLSFLSELLVVICMFVLIVKIRRGSYASLVAYTTVAGLVLYSSLTDFVFNVTMFSGRRDRVSLLVALFVLLVLGPILGLLFKKHRAYFKP